MRIRAVISRSVLSHARGENILRARFKEHNPLSPALLRKKDLGYEEFIKPTGMRCPFMIGFYYQQEHFNGVTVYVERMMEYVKEMREVRILAMLALCHHYGNIGLPQIFVNQFLHIPLSSSYLRNYPNADAVRLPIQDELGGDIDTYNPKHCLVSRELLKQCCQRLYGNTTKTALPTCRNCSSTQLQRALDGAVRLRQERPAPVLLLRGMFYDVYAGGQFGRHGPDCVLLEKVQEFWPELHR